VSPAKFRNYSGHGSLYKSISVFPKPQAFQNGIAAQRIEIRIESQQRRCKRFSKRYWGLQQMFQSGDREIL